MKVTIVSSCCCFTRVDDDPFIGFYVNEYALDLMLKCGQKELGKEQEENRQSFSMVRFGRKRNGETLLVISGRNAPTFLVVFP